MARINQQTLEDLEFPTVLKQIAEYCITDLGTVHIAKLKPFRKHSKIHKELHKVKEFTASFGSDNPIPNHGFENINKELQLLGIEESSIEVSGFRRILSVCITTGELLLFLKKK